MSDDASYAAFLDKANADPKASISQSTSTSQSRSKFDPTTSTSSSLPPSLQCLPDVTYTSDTDSPFEPVLLNYSGYKLPSAVEFAKCVAGKAPGNVEELSVDDFDPRGEYKEVIQRVEQAGSGDVKVYRVEVSKTRAEYYILTLGEGMLIGVVVKAVES
ncbi:uncharacterized protein Z518_06339 [Rhinocladiella mackenziei CBS 650.93]|uniref:Uncharacterized protein n=1 Tax=Rhinocladiella mackenziei CBS 650.93 TaxID=1442369 RepID=A0A0D2FTQ8_9EURO|nr:uncharacterized protein Z518_06339 [Rhinocladiella mackenziei CBS 650.93]KIX05467.1 hypothetical protein Z518_06339 [Rhinocladiella mackenziei CBS 650.93]